MDAKNFTTTILVNTKDTNAVYDAINHVRDWWTGEIEGGTFALGDEFIYRYGDLHYSKHKLVEMIPGRKIVWQTTDSRLNSFKDKTEWNGTTITFDITPKDGQTEVRFTHAGLVPAFECYGDCSGAWTGFIQKSLRSFIETGKAEPAW
ncbi:SRPBCC family protein [Dinghuibacter silviterrae]|uniref:Activator of Hsp90 ATPase-like protein n=1 Tax=Dinghuibacter silviterrae TaxID=1539049 RepID=A0A4V3GM49_9BACT|nr:SRPBCC domain-containing protein [Dinghuibacter silviterrae]TDX02083.1 activator of Hsp90 ATPase-like protein [Dinghuibacter silviterrae]